MDCANDQFWLFGGALTNLRGKLNDLWRWDGKYWVWESGSQTTNDFSVCGNIGIVSPSNILGVRSDAVSWIDGNGRFWIFGGVLESGGSIISEFRLNDLWRLEP